MISRKELNYLNIQEIKAICKSLEIPFYIHYKNKKGAIVKSGEVESKTYLLDKIEAFLRGEKVLSPITYSENVVSFAKEFKQNYRPNDLVLFGDFKSTNKFLLSELQKLTDGKFKFGAIAFIEAHKLWRKNKTVTLEEFSRIWMNAMIQHKSPLEEWAYMTDLKNGFEQKKWKKFREEKASELMKEIFKLIPLALAGRECQKDQ